MTKYTNFDSFQNLLDKSTFVVKSAEDFRAIPDEDWNNYIKNNTCFDSWNEMQEKAVQIYIKAKLTF